MLVIIDECLPADAFRAAFEARGHTVRTVGEGFPSGSPDRSIHVAADALGAVVVTSDSDWQTLIRRLPSDLEKHRFRAAGRILFNCSHPVAIRRLDELMDDIEEEFAKSQKRGIPMLMRITGGNFRFER